jgi:hypothetical protein
LQRFRDWFAGLPAIGLFVYFAAVFGVVFGFLGGYSVAGSVAAGLLFASLMTPLTLRQRKKSGGTAARLEVSAAIRSGKLPGLIDPVRWLASLEQRRNNLRQVLYLGGTIFGILIVSQVIVIALANGDVLRAAAWLALGIAGMCIAVIPAVVQLPRIRELETEIRSIYA